LTIAVDIAGLEKAEVLAALFNASHALGMGLLHYDTEGMQVEEARELLTHQRYFDYLQGRVMKIEIPEEGDLLNPWGYDRDNGEGAVAGVVAALRDSGEINSEEAQATHKEAQLREIRKTKAVMATPTTIRKEDGMTVVSLGLADMSSKLNAAADVAIQRLGAAKEELNSDVPAGLDQPTEAELDEMGRLAAGLPPKDEEPEDK
jgi:hypothetical protein